MMDGKTFDRLISTLEKHLKNLVSMDDDGKIDEDEFHVLCERSSRLVKKSFKKHSDFVTVTGAVDGDALSFRVVYYCEAARCAYDRTIEFGVRSVFAGLPGNAKKEISEMMDKKIAEALGRRRN